MRAATAGPVATDGTPLTADAAAADARAALRLGDPLPPGAGPGASTEVEPGSGIDHDRWSAGAGRYRLAVACAGTGTVHLTIAATSADVPCSYPPRRRDVAVGGAAPMSLRYESASSAPARVAYQLLPA